MNVALPLVVVMTLVGSTPSTIGPTVTAIRSESVETAVTSASAGRPRTSLEIVIVRVESFCRSMFVTPDARSVLRAGSTTVTLTSIGARVGRFSTVKVRTAGSDVAELPVMVKVAIPDAGIADSSIVMLASDD